MKADEIKVASSMSNMSYRTIGEIADIAGMSWLSVRKIILKFIAHGLAESTSSGWTTYYRLK